MTTLTVDLSRLPPPAVVEDLSVDAVRADVLAALVALWPDAAQLLPSDPASKVIDLIAYRELLLRQRINDAARSLLLATAAGADLDHLAAPYEITRLVVDPGDTQAVPPRPPVMESDASLRARVALAPAGASVAGPAAAYLRHARQADGRVLDASVLSPAPGDVLVSLLSSEPGGVASAELVAAVQSALSAEDVRPLTDRVTVRAGTPVPYAVTAALTLYSGPAAEVVLASARASVAAFAARQRRLGEWVTVDGLHAALRVEGVRAVTLASPAADIRPDATGWPECSVVSLMVEGLP